MIDLNCHLLSETNCGPRGFAQALELCRQSLADGVRLMVATPRWGAELDAPPRSVADYEHTLEQLRLELSGRLSLKLGFTLRFRLDLASLLERYGRALTLAGGRYVLVSLPSLRIPDEAETVWDAVGQMGYSVLVARPECSPALRRGAERLGRWIASGIHLQLDAASLTGAHGRDAQSFALRLAREYPGHVVVASNAHDGRRHHASLKSARAELTKKINKRCAQLLTDETPAKIINSVSSDSPPAQERSASNTFLSRWRSPKTLLNES